MYGLELVKIGAGGPLLCSLRRMTQDINEQLHLDVLYNMQVDATSSHNLLRSQAATSQTPRVELLNTFIGAAKQQWGEPRQIDNIGANKLAMS